MVNMSKEFCSGYLTTHIAVEWLTYCGCPMLYDGGLCVNRTPEEVEQHTRFKYNLTLEF